MEEQERKVNGPQRNTKDLQQIQTAFLAAGLIAALAVYYLMQPSQTALEPLFLTDIACDASVACPEGYGCVSVEGKSPVCAVQDYANNPCEFHKCPLFKQCVVLESFPPLVRCA